MVSSIWKVARALIFHHSPQPDASARLRTVLCKGNLTVVSVPGDVSVYLWSFYSHYQIILFGDRGGGV